MTQLCNPNMNLLKFFRNAITGRILFVVFLISIASTFSCRNRRTKFCPIESCHTKMIHKHAEVPMSEKKKDKIKKKLGKGKDANVKMTPADSLENIAKETKNKEKEDKEKAKEEAKKQKQIEKANAKLEKEKNDPKAAEKALAKENKKKEKEAKKLAKAERKKNKKKKGEGSDSTATADTNEPVDESKSLSGDTTKSKSDSLARKGSDYRGRPWYYINQNPKIGQLHRDIQHDDGKYKPRQGFRRRNGNYLYCRFLKTKNSVN